MLVTRSAWNSSARKLPCGPWPVTGSWPWITLCLMLALALLETLGQGAGSGRILGIAKLVLRVDQPG